MTNDPREILRTAITDAAQGRAIDPEVCATLIESSGKVTVAADGTVTGADAAVAELLAEKPYLRTPLPPLGQGRNRERQPKASGVAQGYRLHAERSGKDSPIVAGRQEFI